MQRDKHIYVPPKPGINPRVGAYWSGVRAETIVQARADERARSRRLPRHGGGGPRKPRSPHAEMRRLERALVRRRTLAGRASVQARIDQLTKEMK